MRITGGNLRGRQVIPPANLEARPTTDFAKEGLFNILTNSYEFAEISVLDLFSGTGSISFEFASRGCMDITSVEMNTNHATFIKNSMKLLGITNGIHVIHHNVFDFLNICTKRYDVVFADPPYDLAGFADVPQKILNAPIFKEDAILIFEHPASFDYKEYPHFLKEKKYGNVHFTFFSSEARKIEQ